MGIAIKNRLSILFKEFDYNLRKFSRLVGEEIFFIGEITLPKIHLLFGILNTSRMHTPTQKPTHTVKEI